MGNNIARLVGITPTAPPKDLGAAKAQLAAGSYGTPIS